MNDNTQKNNQNILASPKARKFARELGVDVKDVVGTERLGRVIEKDIKEFVSSKINKNFSKKNEKEIIKIPYTSTGDETVTKIPDWVKTNAEWWVAGQISDTEFTLSLQYLIEKGIILVNTSAV